MSKDWNDKVLQLYVFKQGKKVWNVKKEKDRFVTKVTKVDSSFDYLFSRGFYFNLNQKRLEHIDAYDKNGFSLEMFWKLPNDILPQGANPFSYCKGVVGKK